MKKLFTVFLIITLCLALFACGGDTDPCTEHTDADGNGKCDVCDATVEPAGGDEGGAGASDIELIKNGDAAFKVVASTELQDKLGKTLTSFVKDLKDLTSGVELTNTTAGEDDTEIIVGPITGGAAELGADPYAYGYEGWAIKIVGNKILVLAGSNTAYKNALAYLSETVFGITDTTNELTNVTMRADQAKTAAQTEFDLTLSIEGNPISEYVFAIDPENTYALAVIDASRDAIYKKTGAYLKTVSIDSLGASQKAIFIETIPLRSAGSTDEGFIIYVEDGSLHIESDFPEKLEEQATAYLKDEIAGTKKSSINIANGTVKTVDVRNIYYSEFGAVGNGAIDDFDEIKACHDYANKWGHTVNASKDAVYYIGNGHGYGYISVRTDTNWNGCKFIFDDSGVKANDPERTTAIFHVESDYAAETYSGSTLPFTSLVSGATNLGWAPGIDCMIVVYNDNVKHFIRYGANQGSDSQHEILMVKADGTIDPSTPVQWDYTTVTKVKLYHTDDRAITISGGTENEKALIETIFNGAELSQYTYYKRNIYITRSNTILENVEHIISNDIPEAEGGTGAPYQGFTQIEYCSDVTVRGMIYQHPEFRHVYNDPGNRMGSYEMWASHSNNVLWYGCTQSNFYNDDGSVTFHGMMNSNFCKNITLDNMLTCSFDAHQGVYNATVKNSTLEHMNFIGDGLITVENVTVYVDGSQHAAMNFRDDYGSTWWGDVKIDGLTMKYSDDTPSYEDIAIMKVYWYNWDFGYKTSLPQNVWIKDVVIEHITYSVDSTGRRTEEVIATNDREVSLFSKNVSQNVDDLSDPDELISGQSPNINPTEGTKTVTLINKNPQKPINIIWPSAKQFKDLDVTVDGVLIIEDGVRK